MSYQAVADKLNILSLSLAVNANLPCQRFVADGVIEGVYQLINRLAPCGKGLFVAYEDTYKKLYNKVLSAVKRGDGKLVVDVFTQGKLSSLDSVAHMFNFSEDIRYIVYSDLDLAPFVTYYAKVKNLPIIYIPNSLCVWDSLLAVFKIKNGNDEDKISFNGSRYIILDEEYIDIFDRAEAYAYIVSQLVTLTDYRIFGSMVRRKLDEKPYSLIKEGVIRAFNLFKYSFGEQNELLLEEGFKIEIANQYTLNTIIEHGSVNIASKLCQRKDGKGSACLLAADKILALFKEYCNADYEFLKLPNYNERAEILARKTGISEKTFLNALKQQLFYINKYQDTVKLLKADLKAETEQNALLTDKMKKTYIALLTSPSLMPTEEEVIKAIKYCGDFTERVNVGSFLRESGFTEMIEDGEIEEL